nr:MAG TPA: hypothetical protein [Caudoviricetes sp.]
MSASYEDWLLVRVSGQFNQLSTDLTIRVPPQTVRRNGLDLTMVNKFCVGLAQRCIFANIFDEIERWG